MSTVAVTTPTRIVILIRYYVEASTMKRVNALQHRVVFLTYLSTDHGRDRTVNVLLVAMPDTPHHDSSEVERPGDHTDGPNVRKYWLFIWKQETGEICHYRRKKTLLSCYPCGMRHIPIPSYMLFGIQSRPAMYMGGMAVLPVGGCSATRKTMWRLGRLYAMIAMSVAVSGV